MVNRADQVSIFHEGFLIHLSEAQMVPYLQLAVIYLKHLAIVLYRRLQQFL